uniref:Uncharacterized protein n=1 Tax=Rangifer tarandus platyrhynchus TaxID=3082113 RepID=A0ACB0E7U6_RANTA|nr:unnamed protein product [Rangifer tarandus platyrhynchus]
MVGSPRVAARQIYTSKSGHIIGKKIFNISSKQPGASQSDKNQDCSRAFGALLSLRTVTFYLDNSDPATSLKMAYGISMKTGLSKSFKEFISLLNYTVIKPIFSHGLDEMLEMQA